MECAVQDERSLLLYFFLQALEVINSMYSQGQMTVSEVGQEALAYSIPRPFCGGKKFNLVSSALFRPCTILQTCIIIHLFESSSTIMLYTTMQILSTDHHSSELPPIPKS